MNNFRFFSALIASAAFALGVMMAMQSCSRDKGPRTKLTLTCSVNEVTGEYTTFKVKCEADVPVDKEVKYFYADTVPYSDVKDPANIRSRVGEMQCEGSKYNFDPRHEYSHGGKYDLNKGEMIAVHSLESAKRYYIGAYVVYDDGIAWSEPFIYDVPQSLSLSIEVTKVTSRSVNFEVRFSRPTANDCFIGDLTCSLWDFSPEAQDEQFLTLTPFEGEVTVLKGSFKGMLPNRKYDISLPYKTKYEEGYIFTESFTTPTE